MLIIARLIFLHGRFSILKRFSLFAGMAPVLFSAASWAFDTDLSNDQTSLENVVLPEMAAISDVREKKSTFFQFLNPIVEAMNQKVQAERAWLKLIEVQINQGLDLELWQSSLLAELGAYYKVDEEPGSNEFFHAMYRRVDVIPASLVLAQAANESAWGTSRFATEGNNLFGQWCFTKGCGLVPTGRDSSARHEVKVFDSIAASVAAYFRNLNTHHQYSELRTIRSEMRFLGLPIDSTYLAWGLEGYSIRGELYIRELIDMIQHNRLQNLDQPAYYARNDVQIIAD
jgi:Bax protein